MDITTGLIAWASYWLGYITFAGLLPGDPVTDVRRWQIAIVVFRNCTTTFILSAVVAKIFEGLPTIDLPWYFSWPLSYLIMDMTFYGFHRAMHFPILYSWHKQHHSINFAYPASALYCSTLEAAGDTLTHTIGPLIFGFGRTEICLWSALIALHSLILHSHLEPRYHLTHHIRQNCNYGITSIFDKIFGTKYVLRVQSTGITSTPARSLYGLADVLDIARGSNI